MANGESGSLRGFLFARFISRMEPVVRGLLKSPLHFFVSDRLLLLGYEGRRSGKLFTIVVGYAEVDSTVLVLLSNTPDRSWWRNFRSPWPATLRIRGCQRQFEGCFIEPGSSEFREAFEIMFRRFPEIRWIDPAARDAFDQARVGLELTCS